MALATRSPGGQLKSLNDKCKIKIEEHTIIPRILPEISDNKSVTWSDIPTIGRSSPIKAYSYSNNRVIAVKLHFIVVEEADFERNLSDLRAIQSATYPRQGTPYRPPPVCTIDCGKILGDEPLCVVLENYSVSFPTNVVWDKNTLMPYYFEVNTSWHVVYSTSENAGGLPNQDRILRTGR